MNDNDIRNAFGDTPEAFKNSVQITLEGLEEITVKKHIRRTVVFALAALIALLGVAFAAGSSYLFEKLGKTPMEGAENDIVEVAGEPIKVNDDITATVDSVYFVGDEIMYEMTLTLTDPAKYELIDNVGKYYAPPEDIIHIYTEPCLWDNFEFGAEQCTGDPYADGNFGSSENHVLENIGDGLYKLYGNVIMNLNGGVTMLDELDVDVNLNLYYAPQHTDFKTEQEPIEANIPFHIVRSSGSSIYTLTPAAQPDGWTITEATLEVSNVNSLIRIKYEFNEPLVPEDERVYDFDDPRHEEQSLLINEHIYKFILRDPANPDEHIDVPSDGSGDFETFDFEMEIPAMEDVPESLTFDVTYCDYYDDTYDELPLTTIEFIVTEAE